MKKFIYIALFLSASMFSANAQQTYFTSQGENIFSWSQYTGETGNGSIRTRFTLFPNTSVVYNMDSRGILGAYTGFSFNNVGFNWGDPEKHKRRSLSLGVPLVVKIGDLENDNFFFFGGEAEVFFHYKKKDWTPAGEKIKYTEWFSDELNIFQPSVSAGYCVNKFMFKVKYYLFDFFNEDFQNANGELIYQGAQPSNIFYFSIAFRQDMGGDDFDFDDDGEGEGDEGFDFGYNNLDLLYERQ